MSDVHETSMTVEESYDREQHNDGEEPEFDKEEVSETALTQGGHQDTLNQLKRYQRLYEKVKKCNEELRLENEDIKRQLHEYRISQRSRVNVAVQTCEEMNDYTKYWDQYHSKQNSNICDTGQEASGNPKIGDLGDDGMPVWNSASAGGENKEESLADGLKTAVTEVLQENGVVYDENSGLYYDYDSGYYFDAERSLYYEPHSGTYYMYDTEERRYKIHSRVDLTQYHAAQQSVQNKDDLPKDNVNQELKRGRKRKKKKKKERDRKLLTSADNADLKDKDVHDVTDALQQPVPADKQTDKKDSNVDDAFEQNIEIKIKSAAEKVSELADCDRNMDTESEVVDESKENKTISDGEITSEDDMEEGEISDTDTSESDVATEPEDETNVEDAHFAPCIRAMVTTSDSLDVGSLFIITCQGGTLGREQGLNHAVVIPDFNVSKMHASIEYNEELKKYVLRDHASQNGTFLNKHRLSAPKVMSSQFPIGHMNVLNLGGTDIELHIHPGTETCDGCEPGQVQANLRNENRVEAQVLSKEEKDKLRRKELKNIKRKFGLENVKYGDDAKDIKNLGYSDKAAERRRTKGSDNPYQLNDPPASVERSIPETNKGHKMLAKMGWKEGHGLGADEQGRSEPVSIQIRSKAKAGLGSQANQMSLDDVHLMASSNNWMKARERFDKLVETNTPVFTPSQLASNTEEEQKSRKRIWVPGGTVKPS